MEILSTVGTIVGIISTGLGAALLTPWGQGYAARWTRSIKQTRSLARVNSIPEYDTGARLRFFSADVGGGSAKVGNIWILAEKAKGRILLIDEKDGSKMPMTVREFEDGTAIILPEKKTAKPKTKDPVA